MRYQYRKCTYCGRTLNEDHKWINPGEPCCYDYRDCIASEWENNLVYYDRSKPSTEEILWPRLD